MFGEHVVDENVERSNDKDAIVVGINTHQRNLQCRNVND